MPKISQNPQAVLKNLQNLFFFLILGLIVFNFSQCSNRMPITGGPKDTIPPFVKESFPRHQGLNHQGQKISITFNEWIREKQLLKALLITPPVQSFTFKINKNRVEVTVLDTLKPNTTYNFNFRNGIEDINEGNTAVMDTLKREPLRLAFSTGSVIDTLSIRGSVMGLLNNKPMKEIIISMYREDDTLKIDKHKPYYFTISDEKGNFRIDNIRAGKYKIYALQDDNNNFTYQEPEMIGFLAEGITVSPDSMTNIQLKLVKEDHTPPKLLKNSPLDTDYIFEFDEPVSKYKIELLDNKPKDLIASALDDKKKLIKLYNLKAQYDSLQVKLMIDDTLGNQLIDTIKFAFKKEEGRETRRTRKGNENRKGLLTLSYELKTGAGVEKNLDMAIQFDKPISTNDFTKLRYRIDGDTLQGSQLLFADSLQYFEWNEDKTNLAINKFIKFEKEIEVLADSGAFVSIKNDTNKLYKQKFSLKDPDKAALIAGRVNTQAEAYIIQLLTEKATLVKEQKNVKSFNFGYLPAGTYQIRIIIDRNRNGRWDSSDVLKNISPEEIFFRELPNNGKVREGWELQGADLDF
jgi:uncharacterized protein (DUF2141 family)